MPRDGAQRELTALLGRAPAGRPAAIETASWRSCRSARSRSATGLLVRPGEVVPVDGLVRGALAVLDEAALTGESRLVDREDGDTVSSGVVNAGGPFDLQAIATADASTYAGIVRLVEEAGRAKAPVRPTGRPVRPVLRAPHAGDGRTRVAHLRRPDPRARGPGRGDPLPPAAGRPDRHRRGDLSRRPARDHRQGRRPARVPGSRPRPPVRQDRDPHRRAAAPGVASKPPMAIRIDCCASPPRSNRPRPTSWRLRSCRRRASAGWTCRSRPT